MKVFGHPMSTCTRKVLTTLGEGKVPHEFVTVDLMTGEHKQPAHLARHPFGQVPTIDDDGFTMYESRAICRYLDGKHGIGLVPADPRQRALMEQWISVETSNFTPSAMALIYPYVFKAPEEAAKIERGNAGLARALPVMEAQLGKSKHIAGESFTLADICFLPYVDYLMPTPARSQFEKFPRVMDWWRRISERPSWRKAAGRD